MFSWNGLVEKVLSPPSVVQAQLCEQDACRGGKQTMLLVEICWQRPLRHRHWEWCGHLQLQGLGWAVHVLQECAQAVPELLGWLALI